MRDLTCAAPTTARPRPATVSDAPAPDAPAPDGPAPDGPAPDGSTPDGAAPEGRALCAEVRLRWVTRADAVPPQTIRARETSSASMRAFNGTSFLPAAGPARRRCSRPPAGNRHPPRTPTALCRRNVTKSSRPTWRNRRDRANRFRRPAGPAPSNGPTGGAPDVARRRADLAGPQCRHAAPSRCDGHEAGAAMAWSVVSQKLFDQTLPEPVGSK